MDITPLTPKERLVIHRYGNGGFTVNDTRYEGNLLLTPSHVESWDASGLDDIRAETLALFAASPPEILLIGSGARHERMPEALKQLLHAHSLKADIMDTGAACRTYNILLSEDRLVAAMLLAV